jgi:hypothetical protein
MGRENDGTSHMRPAIRNTEHMKYERTMNNLFQNIHI